MLLLKAYSFIDAISNKRSANHFVWNIIFGIDVLIIVVNNEGHNMFMFVWLTS